MHQAPRQQTNQSPVLSPTSPNKVTSKYTNKDGSKLITAPKSKTSVSPEPSPNMAQSSKTNGQMPAPSTDIGVAPSVNRKKQKRRQKQAARLAAEQPTALNGVESVREVKQKMEELEARLREHGLDEQYRENDRFDAAEGEYYSDEDGDNYSYAPNDSPPNGYANPPNPPGKKSKRKKKKGGQASESTTQGGAFVNGTHNHVSLPLPPLQANLPRGPGISKEKIWNTSSQEERERIKEFWLSLGEDERKSLVKVEKDAVLKKMKEQQKHSCSCTVCGRKRTAIEEELEVLYDAYYEELEQYANHQGDGGPSPMMPPPRRFGVMSGLQPPNRLPASFNGQQPSRGRIVEQLGDDEEEEEGDEEYSEDEEDDYSDEEPEELQRSHATDFFNFGNSLTVQGGILTVADDLLKNDGKKFIEMMEQLAERRMAREEDAREQYANATYHPSNGSMHTHTHTHNHPPPPDDEEYDEEDEEEEDYDSQDEDYDEEEMESMSEEQRMEEGRRMFQIFAARMFEQRVLTAYKEKVAKERQQKLLEELEEESRADSQKKAKKAKDAQKKKDKVQQKKQALAEEKARKEAEKAAEEAAIRAAEEKKAEEQRLKAEEKRKKKEAQKRAEEEERMRKEAEKQRRIQEQRERQAEVERKQRDAKERERKEKEELRQKEREAKEAKEREAKERKEKQEKEKREREAKADAEREQQKREEFAAQQVASSQAAKRPPVPIPANLQPHPPAVASPLIPVATPALPKAPTPIKLRTDSQRESSNGSVPQTPQTGGISQNISPVPSTPLQGSPGPIGPPGKAQAHQPFIYQPQATSPMHSALKGPGMPQNPFNLPHIGFQPGLPMMPPSYGGRMHHDPMFPQAMGGQYRPPNSIPIHPGSQVPQGRGFPVQHPPPGFSQSPLGSAGGSFGSQQESIPIQSHSRHQSGSFEKTFEGPTSLPQAQPIARPAPIGRPSSVVQGHRLGGSGNNEVDDLSNHLGSSALLDDSDEPLNSGSNVRRMSGVPVSSSRQTFPPAPFGMDHSTFNSPITAGGYNYFSPANAFGAPSLPGSNYMAGGFFNSANGPFGAVGGASALRPSQPHGRSVAVRLMLCRACKSLEGSMPEGFTDINSIIDYISSSGEGPVSEKELLDICETEGNHLNGGGSFDVRKDGSGRCSIRHEIDTIPQRPVGVPGEIGSPIVSAGGMSRFPGPPGF